MLIVWEKFATVILAMHTSRELLLNRYLLGGVLKVFFPT